jgi:hypothetical protein
LLDDAQERYSDTDFWANLIKVPEDIVPNTRFIISATYKLDSAVNSPISFSDLCRISREQLLVTDEEARRVLEWCLPRSWQYTEVVDTIVWETCGHIGAAMAAAVCIRAHFKDVDNVSREDLIQFYFSAHFLQGLHRCFGNFTTTPNSAKLRKLLADSIFTNQPSDLDLPQYTEEDKTLLVKMRRFGILKDTDHNVAEFCSPIAQRFTLNWLFPNRPTRKPPNLRWLLTEALSKLSRSEMRSCIPSPGSFQSLFLHAFIQCTPVGCRTIPELGIFFRDENGRQLKREVGRVDFYLNNSLRWGVELLVNRTQEQEHLARFGPEGRYASLNVADYLVVDLRISTGQIPKVQRFDKKATVFFDSESFRFCYLIYGREEETMRIQLAD